MKHHRLIHPVITGGLLIAGIVSLLLALTASVSAQPEQPDPDNPHECAGCHEVEYRAWRSSEHADSLSDPVFIQAWTNAGKPGFCYECHATEYDPVDGTKSYNGVACLSCHDYISEEGIGHMTTDASAENCGECHTGVHAPDYDEWLVSDHAVANIVCSDCHQDHSTALHMEDASELCESCHEIDHENSAHSTANVSCLDCHMRPGDQITDTLSQRTNGSGHTFSIPATVCGDCHGMAHTIPPSDDGIDEVALTQAELATCREDAVADASNNRTMGLTGGGIGGLLIGLSIPFVLKWSKNHS